MTGWQGRMIPFMGYRYLMMGGLGADTLIGGDGYDYAAYWDADSGVEVRLHDGVTQGVNMPKAIRLKALNVLTGLTTMIY